MLIKCDACGYEGEVLEFQYLCMAGWPATGASELRTCPECRERVLLHKPELMENEDELMKELSIRLARVTADSPDYLLDEAKSIIRQLGAYNMRRNIAALDEFILERQRELGLGLR